MRKSQGMLMKSYYVLHVRVHGFWVVACNDNGHYRNVGRYSSQDAAVKAANAYNNQENDTYGQAVLAAGAL
jgi:hypothetical protein